MSSSPPWPFIKCGFVREESSDESAVARGADRRGPPYHSRRGPGEAARRRAGAAPRRRRLPRARGALERSGCAPPARARRLESRRRGADLLPRHGERDRRWRSNVRPGRYAPWPHRSGGRVHPAGRRAPRDRDQGHRRGEAVGARSGRRRSGRALSGCPARRCARRGRRAGGRVLSFSVQPSTATAGNIVTPPSQVLVSDSLGIVDSAFTAAITITIGVNPVGGNLSGTTSVTPVNGTAQFGDLRIDTPGTGYVL